MQFKIVLICIECKQEMKSFGVFGTNNPTIKQSMITYFEKKECDECKGNVKVKKIEFKPNHLELF